MAYSRSILALRCDCSAPTHARLSARRSSSRSRCLRSCGPQTHAQYGLRVSNPHAAWGCGHRGVGRRRESGSPPPTTRRPRRFAGQMRHRHDLRHARDGASPASAWLPVTPPQPPPSPSPLLSSPPAAFLSFDLGMRDDEPEIDVPIAWVLLLVVVCCCACCIRRSCRRYEICARSKRPNDATDDGDMDDDEIRGLVQRVHRIVGYEATRSGRVEYSCLDRDGNEVRTATSGQDGHHAPLRSRRHGRSRQVTFDRRDLMDGGEVEDMVREYERRYPPPWSKNAKKQSNPYETPPATARRKW